MKKIIYNLGIIVALIASMNTAIAQCYTATYGQWPGTAFTPNCNGLFANITTAGYASEYSTVNLVAGNTYTFKSSITTDYITVDNNGAAPLVGVVGVSTVNGISWTCTASGAYRFYTHTSSSCGASTSSRTRSVRCAGVAAPAPANDLVANATLITCGSNTSGTTIDATNTGTYEGTTFCGVSQGMPGVWYKVAGNGQLAKQAAINATNPPTVITQAEKEAWLAAHASAPAASTIPQFANEADKDAWLLQQELNAKNAALAAQGIIVTP